MWELQLCGFFVLLVLSSLNNSYICFFCWLPHVWQLWMWYISFFFLFVFEGDVCVFLYPSYFCHTINDDVNPMMRDGLMWAYLVSWQTLTLCNNTTGLENQTRPEMNPQCFLRSSPENRVSPRASPNHHISNGPFNKVSAEEFLKGCRFSLVQSVLLTGCFLTYLFLLHTKVSLSLSYSSSLLLPSPPWSFSPPPLLPCLPRWESLRAMRRPWNRVATCTSTMFHRLDTHQLQQ